MTTRSAFALALVPALGLLAGCGSGKKTASASIVGKVTVNGAALTGGTLVFHSDQGTYTTGVKGTGDFELLDIPPGEYTVTADNEFLDPNHKQEKYKGGSGGPPGGPAGGGSKMPGAGKYGGTVSGPGGGPPNNYKGKGQEAYVPEGANVVKDGTYMPIPAKFKKRDTSTVKVTLADGENKKDIALDGK